MNRNCCQALTEKKMPCTRIAKHEYEGKKLCNAHFLKEKRNEECPICYCSMQKECIRLECGHMFHSECLSKNPSQTCPMCRAAYDDKTKSRIAAMRLSAIVPKVTALNEIVQQTVAQSLEGLVGAHPEMAVIMNNTNSLFAMDASCKQVTIYVMQKLLQHVNVYGTMAGFHIMFNDNGTARSSV